MIDTNLLKINLLQKAISGKLSTTFEGEDINNLLESIIRAKQGMRNKKPKYESIPDLDLSIPKTWKMVRLGEVSESQLGKTINSKKDSGIETKYLCNVNITNIGLSLNPLKSTLFSAKELEDYQIHSGDLLVCEGGEVGKNIIYQLPDVIHYQNALYRIRFFGGMNAFYPKLVLDYLKGIGYLNRLGKGVGIQHLNQSLLNSLPIPLPPLEEQKRIVAKIEGLFAKIDEIDKAQKELEELAELAEKKILDMAVRGELVEQDETEGSGNEELNAIEAYLLDNKLLDKKRLNLTVTVDEPFPIPSTWVWTKIGFVTNYADKKEKATERIHLPTKLIDMENIVKDTGEFIDVTNVADISNLADRVVFHKSDVLYGRLRPYLRKIAVAKYDGICSPEIVPFRGYFHVDSEYLCAVMRSGYISSAVNLAMHGVNMPRASKELIQNLAFPLPPYFEQVRISNAVKAFVENIRLLY